MILQDIKVFNANNDTFTSQLENVKLSPDFFKKQAERRAKRMKEAKALRLSMQPSWEHTQRVFGRLKGE